MGFLIFVANALTYQNHTTQFFTTLYLANLAYRDRCSRNSSVDFKSQRLEEERPTKQKMPKGCRGALPKECPAQTNPSPIPNGTQWMVPHISSNFSSSPFSSLSSSQLENERI